MLHSFVRRAAHACAALLLLAACDGPTDPGIAGHYQLATIEGQPLPTPYTLENPPYPAFNVVSGSLMLDAGGTATETLTLRCRTDLPDWVSCQQQGDLLVTRSGTHTAEPLEVRTGDDAVNSRSTTASRARIVLLSSERGSSHSESFEYVR
jgi:hypothetical protein